MVEEKIFDNINEYGKARLDVVVDAAEELYCMDKAVRILDLATGPNGLNQFIVKQLVSKEIDYELVLSDISPKHFRIGYGNLERELPQEELLRIVCVLADSGDLRKDDSRSLRRYFRRIPVWGEGRKSLNEILNDPEYGFLSSGYPNGKRIERFEDESFDIVMGCSPYGNIGAGKCEEAIIESARVLRKGGYHIVDEIQVKQINQSVERTASALERANAKQIDSIRNKLDAVLNPIIIFSATQIYRTDERIPDQTIQDGDIIKSSILVHRK
ncbi:MAG: class I SAM-dependent methyltransferase [Candidatus Paceibacterota bacterium]